MSGKAGKGPGKKSGQDGWQAFLTVSQLGVNMAVCIVGGFWLGQRLDRWLGTSPWLLIVLTLLGVGAAFKVMFDYAGK
jgi:ATP synthase protein I